MKCLKCSKPLKSDALHGFRPACFQEEFDLADPADFEDIREKTSSSKSPQSPDFEKFNSSFFHGAYKKYLAALGGKSYILKVKQDEYPELPVVECVSNKIARFLGLEIPDFHFINFQNKRPTFLSQNILDGHPQSALHHIYKYLDKKDSFDCETLAAIIHEQTGRLGDVHEFVKLCLFDSLVGNHDRHGRNLAFMQKIGNGPMLAPFYDNPSYLGIAERDFLKTDLQPRGKIATKKTREPVAKDYIEEFKRLGFGKVVETFQERIRSQCSEIIEIVNQERNLSPERKVAFVKLIDKRVNEFENN